MIHEANDHFLELLGYGASDLPGGKRRPPVATATDEGDAAWQRGRCDRASGSTGDQAGAAKQRVRVCQHVCSARPGHVLVKLSILT